MRVEATSVAEYFEKVDPARRPALEAVAEVVRKHLPRGFEEGLLYGAVAWFVPPERYGKSYNGQPLAAVALATQKHHLGLYLHCGYMADELASVAKGFAAAGKRLDMGKSCVRFRHAEDLALEVIGNYLRGVSVERFLADYERGQAGRKQKPISWRRPPAVAAAPAARPKVAAAKPAPGAAEPTAARAAKRPAVKAAAVGAAKKASSGTAGVATRGASRARPATKGPRASAGKRAATRRAAPAPR